MLDELAFDPLASFDSIKQEGHSSEARNRPKENIYFYVMILFYQVIVL